MLLNSNNTRKKLALLICLAAAILLSAAVIGLGYAANRSETWSLLGLFATAFIGFGVLLKFTPPERLFWAIGLGILLRACLVPAYPLLSDDIYRFIWDGRMWAMGMHPFAFTPEEVIQQGLGDAKLFELLNSPRYYTVYPPINQAIFWFSAFFDVRGAILVIKTALFLAELGTIGIIYRFLRAVYPEKLETGVLVYALNPLVIVETIGNGHFEGMMVGGLFAALFSLHQGQLLKSGAWWALGIAVKLLPILLAPLVFAWLPHRKARLQWGLAVLVSSILLFIPLLNFSVLGHLIESISLYFQQFEFNASLYYLLAYSSPFFTGWYEGRTISLMLAEVTVAVVIGLSWRLWRLKTRTLGDLQDFLLISLFVYLLNATTVHPWYVIVVLGLAAGSGYWTPVAWSCLVILSYSHYYKGVYLENYALIALEYIALLAFFAYTDWGNLKKWLTDHF